MVHWCTALFLRLSGALVTLGRVVHWCTQLEEAEAHDPRGESEQRAEL